MGLTQVNTSSHLGQSYHVGRNINSTLEIYKTAVYLWISANVVGQENYESLEMQEIIFVAF